MNEHWPNHPAAGNAALALGLAIGPHWRGMPEPARSAVQELFTTESVK
jgi:hypothetical protein